LQPTAGKAATENRAGAPETTALPPAAAAPAGTNLALPSNAKSWRGDWRDYAQGILTDPRTGLRWTAKDSGSDLSWDSAEQYCAQLTLGGYTGWRLPTNDELKGIYDPNNVAGKYGFPGLELSVHTINGFHLSNYVIWSENFPSAGFFRFEDGEHFLVRRENLKAAGAFPALCVFGGFSHYPRPHRHGSEERTTTAP
jgi:hypothetical protein